MCSYRRTRPTISPSASTVGTLDSAKDWRLPYGSQQKGSPLRNRSPMSRNNIFVGPAMAQAIFLRCTSSDEEEADDEERMEIEEEEGDQSRTDASEDSIEVRVLPIAPNPQTSLLQKNKRKLAEPRKVAGNCKAISRESRETTRHRLPRVRHCSRLPRPIEDSSPTKKHCTLSRVNIPRDSQITQTALCPFRPWSSETLRQHSATLPTELTPPPSTDGSNHHDPLAIHSELRNEPSDNSEEPLSLVLTSNCFSGRRQDVDIPDGKSRQELWQGREVHFTAEGSQIVDRSRLIERPSTEAMEAGDSEDEDEDGGDMGDRLPTTAALNMASGSSASSQRSGGVNMGASCKDGSDQKSHLRNYKNMTRERRMEANARERTRVHTISAAFDTLRRAVPAYAHNQRLSKLSVLRIACAYIVTLSRVAGKDYSAGSESPSLSECVDTVTRTIQTEGKVRRRRDE